MKIHALEIPDERKDQLHWLENYLAGIDLSHLVSELRVVHDSPGFVSLDEIMGDQLPEVLESGLSSLEDWRLRLLLRNPECLFELQEQILLEGSAYWQQLSKGQTVDVDTGFDSLRLAETMNTGVAERTMEAAVSRPTVSWDANRSGSWYRHPLVVSLATAAAILMVAGALKYIQRDHGQAGIAMNQPWGWDRPGALALERTPVAYINRLADSAEEWFDQRPETVGQLATRLVEMRKACSTLILAEHPSLGDEDRRWLKGKCRLWAETLDSHLIAVEDGRSVSEVREAADRTVTQLVSALRERANHLVA